MSPLGVSPAHEQCFPISMRGKAAGGGRSVSAVLLLVDAGQARTQASVLLSLFISTNSAH